MFLNMGYIHAHAEKHRGWGPFNLIPQWPGDVEDLMTYTEVVKAEVTHTIDPTELCK